MNEAEWSTAISAVRISTDDDEERSEDADGKVTLALFGGAYASQPAGRELLLRLARHLAEGVKRGDGEVAALLKRCRVFILPAVDAAGFDPRQEGRCERKRRSSFSPRAAKAVRQFLRSHKVDAALSLESGGLFVRMPWDDSSRMRKNSTKVRQEKTLISYFIQTIFFPSRTPPSVSLASPSSSPIPPSPTPPPPPPGAQAGQRGWPTGRTSTSTAAAPSWTLSTPSPAPLPPWPPTSPAAYSLAGGTCRSCGGPT